MEFKYCGVRFGEEQGELVAYFIPYGTGYISLGLDISNRPNQIKNSKEIKLHIDGWLEKLAKGELF